MARDGSVSGGRPKGSVNKDRKIFLDALNDMFVNNAPEMMSWLAQIEEPEKRFDILNKFANYLHPKLSSVESKNETKVVVEAVDINFK